MNLVSRAVFVSLMLAFPMQLFAGMAIFNVDFSGTDADGHELSVVGEITLDPDLDVGMAIQSSSLSFKHGSDVALLSSVPSFYSADASTRLDWQLDGNDLYITRTTGLYSQISWTNSPGGFFRNFDLGSGTVPHQIVYGDNFNTHSGIFILNSASGPDGPNGFLVGVTVPEPGSFSMALIGLFGLALVRIRSRKL